MWSLPPELKFSQLLNNGQSLSTTWNLINTTGMAQGDDIGQRNGQRITPEGLWLRACVGADPTVGLSAAYAELRRIIFIDWGCTGAVPAQGDVFLNNSDPKSVKNYQNSQRFQIVKDDYMLIVATTAAGTVTPYSEDTYVDLSKYFRRRGKITQYIGTGATATSIGGGQVFIAYITDQSITGSSNIGLSYAACITYFDN